MPRKHGAYESVREAILQNAAALFLRRGVHATSLQDITAAAQLSKGTLYYYYPTKDSLVEELAHNNIEAVTDALFTWVDSLSRGDDMNKALLRLIDVMTGEGALAGLHLVLCAEAALGNTALQEVLGAAYREWSVMLEVGVLKAQSRDASHIRANARLFFTMLLGYLLQCQGDLGAPDKQALADLLLS